MKKQYSSMWALCVVMSLLGACTASVSTDELKIARAAVAKGTAIILDVRTPGEFKNGHIEGAINIPLGDIAALYSGIPKNKALVVYCQSGGRSRAAASFLRNKGRTVYDIGTQRAWDAS